MLTVAFLISAFTTLFVVIDPIGLVPMFIVTTQGHRDRAKIALRACLIAAGILTLFGFLGDAILAFVGISMPAFRIAGGILLFLTLSLIHI
jgi:multiple antibiotic resistance protein